MVFRCKLKGRFDSDAI
jgi:hypothetical protein